MTFLLSECTFFFFCFIRPLFSTQTSIDDGKYINFSIFSFLEFSIFEFADAHSENTIKNSNKTNMTPTVHVENLKKEFVTFQREAGFWNAVKSLVSRKYETKEAVRGISFDIKEGEIVGFVGPNGAGKSTTIKALAGVLYPTSGTVNVLGFVPWKERTKYVKHIGVVLGQKTQMAWDLPPVDTFYLNRDLYDIDKQEFETRLASMVALLGVERVIKTPVHTLSLGERMRCELIASLLHKPKLVFLDEPSIGLDVIAKEKLREFILEINRTEKTTFIITSHDMQDIERLCKRLIIINHGVLIYDGSLERIKKEYITHKHIEVQTTEKIKPIQLRGCTVLEQEGLKVKLEVDVTKQKVQRVIDHVLKKYTLVDILVSDPPIEEIIKQMFARK